MIPAMIETHLRERHSVYEHHRHAVAMSAQELAAAEHVTGYRVDGDRLLIPFEAVKDIKDYIVVDRFLSKS